jgi:hypothetical protein
MDPWDSLIEVLRQEWESQRTSEEQARAYWAEQAATAASEAQEAAFLKSYE